MGLFLASVLGALVISALCSLMEATLLSIRPGQIAEIAARRPSIGGIWRQLKADIDRPIAAILILNTAAHTIGASVAGAAVGGASGGSRGTTGGRVGIDDRPDVPEDTAPESHMRLICWSCHFFPPPGGEIPISVSRWQISR